MNILHLLSNFRWTERAEPTVNLILGQNRIPGVEATLVCGKNRPEADLIDSVVYQAPRLGVEPLVLNFTKHFRLIPAVKDIRSLRRHTNQTRVDVMHCHMPNAILLGGLTARKVSPRPLVVATVYEPDGPEPTLRMRLSAGRVDGWIVMSDAAAEDLRSRYGVSPEVIRQIIPPVDLDRFSKAVELDGKAVFGLDQDDVVFGMVARYSEARKSEWVIEAFKLIAEDCPKLRLFFVGRGDLRTYVEEPAEAFGVSDRVTLAGYCRYDRLVEAYAAMDAFVYPAPGTDKSARAVREAMAAGLPVVAARTGILPQLVRDGETGLLADPNPEGLATVMRRLYRDEQERRAMGRAALETAQREFSIERQSAESLEFYRFLMEAGSLSAVPKEVRSGK